MGCFDNVVEDISGVKYLLGRQDQFDRNLDAKRLKTDSIEKVGAFLPIIKKKHRPKKVGVDMGTKFGRLWIQVESQSISNRHNPDFQKKTLDRLDTIEYQDLRLFVQFEQHSTTRI